MEYEETIYELRERRLGYKISQQKLAGQIGITREYLSRIESGKKRASDELIKKIDLALRCLSPEEPLEVLFDYMRIRFPTTDTKEVIEKLLRIRQDFMYLEEWGHYGYAGKYLIGDVVVMFSPDIKKGVLLELKGKGCRQFEQYLQAQGRNWYDFLYEVKKAGGVMKRVDLAINDKLGMLSISELEKKCSHDECISRFRTYDGYRSGELSRHREEHKTEMGTTLYIGSKKSEVYFCFYEKDYEQYIKKGTPLIQAEVKNRYEIRVMNDRAEKAVDDLMRYGDAGKTAFAIIREYMRFVDQGTTKDRYSWQMNKDWLAFIGMECRKLKLTMAPEPYTLDKTKKWLLHQASGSLKMLTILDQQQDTNFVGTMILDAKLSRQQEKVMGQQIADIGDIIL